MKKALIEVDSDKNIKSIDTMSALLGFQAKDYEIVYKSTLDLLTKNIDDLKDIDCFFGSLNFSKLVFNFLGVSNEKLDFNTYPFPFTTNKNRYERYNYYDFYKRTIFKMNLESALLYNQDKHIFIKPVKNKEFFVGKIDTQSKNSYNDLLSSRDFLSLNYKYFQDIALKDIECFVSDLITIKSEFRVYIQNNKVINSKQYAGDYHFYLDNKCWNFIEGVCLPELKKQNINTLSLDIGINIGSDYKSSDYIITPFVIECNDAYAIGNYGLDNDVFVEFLETRFNELVKK